MDDDIDAVDEIDAELFPIFEEEADELLPQLQAAGLLVSQPALEGELLPATARALRGALRELPLRVVNQLCRAPAELLQQAVMQATQPDWPAFCALLLAPLEALQAVLQAALLHALDYTPAEVEDIKVEGTKRAKRGAHARDQAAGHAVHQPAQVGG